MKYEEIEKILEAKQPETSMVQISFKTRGTIKGVFIKKGDYRELGRKNLWRIVSETNLDSYNKSQDENLSRIFNGLEFTKLKWTP